VIDVDSLRELLDLPDRSMVSMVQLVGQRETTIDRAMVRTFVRSGDVAFVFVGPAAKMDGVYQKHDDGSTTITIEVAP
jgi:hypothetical protein